MGIHLFYLVIQSLDSLSIGSPAPAFAPAASAERFEADGKRRRGDPERRRRAWEAAGWIEEEERSRGKKEAEWEERIG